MPPYWNSSKDSTPHHPHAIRSELKRVLLSDNVTEQKFLNIKLDKIAVEHQKKMEHLANKKIKFIDELTKRRNPYLESLKYGFEERLKVIPRMRSRYDVKGPNSDLFSAPVVRDAATFLTEHRQASSSATTTSSQMPRLPLVRIQPASAPPTSRRKLPNHLSRSQMSLPIMSARSGMSFVYRDDSSKRGEKERQTLTKKCVEDDRFKKLEKLLVPSDVKKKEPVWNRTNDTKTMDNDKLKASWELMQR